MKKSAVKLTAILLSAVMLFCAIPFAVSAKGDTSNFVLKRNYYKVFSDINSDDWYFASVVKTYRYLLIDGYEDGTFRPNATLSFAEAIKLAAVMYEIYTTGETTLKVEDPVLWYTSYVNYAQKNGLLDGVEISDYEAAADRASIAAIFYNALEGELEEINQIKNGSIPDVPMSHKYSKQIYALYRAGILRGNDEEGSFEPNNGITRAEFAAILTRFTTESERISFALDGETIRYSFYKLSLESLFATVETSFDYNDKMLLNDSETLNSELAKVGVALSAAAYDETGIKNVVAAMEYEVLKQEYNPSGDNTVPYTFVRKAIDNGGNTEYVYLLILRGTADSEWDSNFDVGSGSSTTHAGFSAASEWLLDEITPLIDTDKSANRIFITGHSRGAAVGAIVAAKLTDDAKLFNYKNISAYVYSCPAYTTEDVHYNNIYCFNNPGDIVTELPLESWGYHVAGNEITLSTDSNVISVLNTNMETLTGNKYLGLTDCSGIIEKIEACCPTKADYYKTTSSTKSTYETLTTVLGLDYTTDSAMQIIQLMLMNKFTKEQLILMNTLSVNLVEIYRSHAPETYVAWINAMY